MKRDQLLVKIRDLGPIRFLGARASRHYDRIAASQMGSMKDALFSPRWYLDMNPHLRGCGMDPYHHFSTYGAAEGRSPHPLFDPRHYLEQEPPLRDAIEAARNPLRHYLLKVMDPPRDPHPAFQTAFYLSRYPEVVASGLNPLLHFVTLGAQRLLWPNELFDPEFYLRQDPPLIHDPVAARSPLVHYLIHGATQGRNPHPAFDSSWYSTSNPDVAAAGMNPLVHFLAAGRREGREPKGEFSTRWFSLQSSNERPGDQPPSANFLERASAAGLHRAKADRAEQEKRRLVRFLASSRRIRLTDTPTPEVTVVVVVWNQAHFTLACLESLAASSTPSRVVLIDNASTDKTADLLDRVIGLDIYRNTSNLGFVDAVNTGLQASTTPFTLLLNNDAKLTPDTIRQALKAARDPSVGAVAARIVLPNGLLQEAGSFLWRDGSAQGHLRGQPVSIGAAMHRRDVDFGSGAFLLLRTEVAQRHGGFDSAFKPAYGEEVDLCLRMRAAGYRTVYDPTVVVEHVEFASSKDPSAALALQEEHRTVLEQRHRAVLADRPLGDLKLAHRVAHWATHGMPGVLVVDDRIPFPDQGSGNPRAREVIRQIVEGHVGPTLLAPTHQEPFADWDPVWAEFGLDLEIYPEPGMAGLDRVLEQHAGRYDTVWVSRHHNLKALLTAEERHRGLLDGVRVIYDAEAVTALREAQQAALCGELWTPERAEATVAAEASAARRADVVLAVNELEANLFRAHGACDVRVLGHGLDVQPGPAILSNRSGLVFVGRMVEEDSPNVDSVRWFFEQVWPLWPQADRPALTLVGRIAPELAEEFAAHGTLVTGPVDDVRPYLDAARVFLAPTRFAAGVPHKVHEAAAAGIPVVATPLLVEQLGWTAGRDLLAADHAQGFFDAVTELLESPERWSNLRDAALTRVQEDCDPARFAATIRQVLFGQ